MSLFGRKEKQTIKSLEEMLEMVNKRLVAEIQINRQLKDQIENWQTMYLDNLSKSPERDSRGRFAKRVLLKASIVQPEEVINKDYYE